MYISNPIHIHTPLTKNDVSCDQQKGCCPLAELWLVEWHVFQLLLAKVEFVQSPGSIAQRRYLAYNLVLTFRYDGLDLKFIFVIFP